jgi:hypothetical protein
MENELTELLFRRRIPAIGNHTLFHKISEVAEKITQLPPSASGMSGKNQKSIESYLGQVLRCDRKCSSGLQEAILAAVVARLGLKPTNSSDWQEQVDNAIARVNLKVTGGEEQEKTASDPEKLYGRLLNFSKTAQLQVIVTPVSLEEETQSKRANAIRDILTSRLGLQPGKNQGRSRRPRGGVAHADDRARYVFVLPGTQSAQGFWANLFYEITGRIGGKRGLDEAEASKRLNTLDQDNDLEVYVATNSAICSLPIVAFDPDPRRGSRAAFSFCFDNQDVIRIVEWDDDATRAWVDNFYKPFCVSPVELVRRYNWEEAKKRLRRG